jgi:DnaJ family protein A protein 2
MSDYYAILGVDKDSSTEDIKQSYKKLAMKHHPDKGGDSDTFKKISEAYETLSDPHKREAYDNPMAEFGINPNDILKSFFQFNFGGSKQPSVKKLQDIIQNVDITMKDSWFGCVKTFKHILKKKCETCVSDCKQCKGSGESIQLINNGFFQIHTRADCPECKRRGYMVDKKSSCGCNDGIIHVEKTIELSLESGIQDGKTIIAKGLGTQSMHTFNESGDLIFLVKIRNDTPFKRRENELLYSEKLTFTESIVGKTIQIPHFKETITLNTSQFGIIKEGKEYKLPNYGYKGDNLILTFAVEYPTRILYEKERSELADVFKRLNI